MPAIALTAETLLSLEQYAEQRNAFRKKAMAARKERRLLLGDHFCLHFENRLTVQYQIQEMLRIERTFEPAGIRAELDVYNPLISQGSSLRCTLCIEFADTAERQVQLRRMPGIEHRFWLQVAGCDRALAIADEDLARTDGGKTSAVHFMRFELGEQGGKKLRAGAPLFAGIDYDGEYALAATEVPSAIRSALSADLTC